jgi:geranylgeranyl diphosphate synthase, type II
MTLQTTEQTVTPHQAKERIDARLQQFFDQQLHKAAALDARYVNLWQAAAHLTLAGGKRLRPYLVMLGYQSVAQDPTPEALIEVGLAHELLHASLLMHDDIIDQDLQRYGKPNVAGVLNGQYAPHTDAATAHHYASGAALLAGDLLLAAASQVIAKAAIDPAVKLDLLTLLHEAVFTVASGELLDMESGMPTLATHDPLKVAAQKTAYYSFVAPLVSGAILAGGDKEVCEALKVFGHNLGIAYQLADDLLGVFGDEKETGKSNMSDLREGKATYLLQVAMERANDQQKQCLQTALGNPALDAAMADAVRSVLRDTGAVAQTEQTIGSYADNARAAIDTLSMSPQVKVTFEHLVVQATERNK